MTVYEFIEIISHKHIFFHFTWKMRQIKSSENFQNNNKRYETNTVDIPWLHIEIINSTETGKKWYDCFAENISNSCFPGNE